MRGRMVRSETLFKKYAYVTLCVVGWFIVTDIILFEQKTIFRL